MPGTQQGLPKYLLNHEKRAYKMKTYKQTETRKLSKIIFTNTVVNSDLKSRKILLLFLPWIMYETRVTKYDFYNQIHTLIRKHQIFPLLDLNILNWGKYGIQSQLLKELDPIQLCSFMMYF